jgi:hypothetical protein
LFKYTLATSTFGFVYSVRGAFAENADDGHAATGLLLDKGTLYGPAYHTMSFSGATGCYGTVAGQPAIG